MLLVRFDPPPWARPVGIWKTFGEVRGSGRLFGDVGTLGFSGERGTEREGGGKLGGGEKERGEVWIGFWFREKGTDYLRTQVLDE